MLSNFVRLGRPTTTRYAMVLQKRKADGSFEDWHSRTSMPTSTSNKRARTTISDASSYPATHSHCLAPPAPAPSTSRAGPSASTSHYSTAASSSSRKTVEKATKGKGKAKEKPVKEKRKAQFKSKCPHATQTRLDRYISQAQRYVLLVVFFPRLMSAESTSSTDNAQRERTENSLRYRALLAMCVSLILFFVFAANGLPTGIHRNHR